MKRNHKERNHAGPILGLAIIAVWLCFAAHVYSQGQQDRALVREFLQQGIRQD